MSDSKSLVIDMTKEEDILRTIPNHFFSKIHETGLEGRGVWHGSHPACEYPEYYSQQHGIVVHLQPEQNSLRRLGDSVEVENVNVGDVAIVPAHVDHWQRIETDVCEGLILTLEPHLLSRFAHESVDSDRLELLPTFAQSDPLIQAIALSIKSELETGCNDTLYSETLFQTLSLHLLKHYATRQFTLQEFPDGLPSYLLNQAVDYIHAHLDRSIKLTDIAKLLGISQYHFCRQFKLSTGIAPYRYVIAQRLDKAKQLIKQSKLPLANIALECGFSSQSQMTQHFRKCVGVTPKAYRNQ